MGVTTGLMQGQTGAFAERMQGRHLWAVTGRMRNNRSGRVRRIANRNYGGNGSRALIVAAQAAAQLN